MRSGCSAPVSEPDRRSRPTCRRLSSPSFRTPPPRRGRLLTVTVRSQRDARLIYLDLPDSIVLGRTVDGREVPAEQLTGRFGFVFHAPPDDGLTVALELHHRRRP